MWCKPPSALFGKTVWHSLIRGGDRDANNVLWIIRPLPDFQVLSTWPFKAKGRGTPQL